MPVVVARVHRGYARALAFLDMRAFPLVVRYVTHPLVILTTILLIVPLIVYASATALVLLGNTYLNVASASVSSIVLAQSLKHHHEAKQLHARHQEAMAALAHQHQHDLAALHARIDALAPPPELPVRPAGPSLPTVVAAHTRKARTSHAH